MDLEAIRDFLELCRSMSFTKAAKRLYISQPTLSYRISSLEKELGVTLVERSKPIKLTEDGARFFEDVQPIAHQLDSIIDKYKNPASKAAPRATIIARKPPVEPGSAANLLYKALSDFQEIHPEFEVKFIHEPNASFIEQLLEGEVDCAMTLAYDGDRSILRKHHPEAASHPNLDRIVYVPIAEIPLVANMNRRCILADKADLSMSDIESCPVIFAHEAGYDEYRCSLESNLNRYGLRNRKIPLLAAFPVNADNLERGNEVALVSEDCPCPAHHVRRSFLENPLQTVHIAVNVESLERKAASSLKDFLEGRLNAQ